MPRKGSLSTGLPGQPNVSTVVSIDGRLRTASICLAVGYGARHDPPGQGGLAHLLEHVLLNSPVSGGLSLSELVEQGGGYANAETGLDIMLFTVQVLAAELDEVIPMIFRAVFAPEITETVLARERGVVLRELAAAKADPSDAVQDAFMAELFPGEPLGRPVGGTEIEVANMTSARVESGYSGSFLPKPSLLVVVSPTMPSGFMEDQWVPISADSLGDRHLPSVARVETVWPADFVWVCAGGRTAACRDEGRYAATVLAHLLGGSASSVMFHRMRGEQPLAYMFEAWYRGYAEVGAWRILVGLEPDNREDAMRAIQESLAEIAEVGPTEYHLRSARRQAAMRLIRDSESPMEYARQVALETGIGACALSLEDGVWSMDLELAGLRSVNAAAVRRAATAVLETLVVTARS